MSAREHLATRVRAVLSEQPSVREVEMFGGRSFMVADRMVVSVARDGELLVRVDPARTHELLSMSGARPAEMGAGRRMGEDWITIGADGIETDRQLTTWIDVALEYHEAGR